MRLQLTCGRDVTTFRGTSAPHSVINVADGSGAIVKSVTSGDDGRWEVALTVGMGENDFSITARGDHITAKDAPIALRSGDGAAARRADTRSHPNAPCDADACARRYTIPPHHPTPRPPWHRGHTGARDHRCPGATASFRPQSPQDGAHVSDLTVLSVRGSSDAHSVRVSAAWAGTGPAPRPRPTR